MELSSVKRQGKDAKGNKTNQANFLHPDWWAVRSCLENLRHWKLKSLFANIVLNDNAKAFVRLLTIYSNKTSSTVSLTGACAVIWCNTAEKPSWIFGSHSSGSVGLLGFWRFCTEIWQGMWGKGYSGCLSWGTSGYRHFRKGGLGKVQMWIHV